MLRTCPAPLVEEELDEGTPCSSRSGVNADETTLMRGRNDQADIHLRHSQGNEINGGALEQKADAEGKRHPQFCREMDEFGVARVASRSGVAQGASEPAAE